MKIKDRQHLLTVVAIAGIALFLGDKLLLSPLLRVYQDRTAQVAGLRKQVSAGAALLQREPGIRSRWEFFRRNTLPNNPSVSEQQVLKALDLWSQESGVSVMSITPQWKHNADEYMTLECRVDAFGNLYTISRFLYAIEQDPIALKLESVELTARDNDGQQFALGLQLSGLVLTPKTP